MNESRPCPQTAYELTGNIKVILRARSVGRNKGTAVGEQRKGTFTPVEGIRKGFRQKLWILKAGQDSDQQGRGGGSQGTQESSKEAQREYREAQPAAEMEELFRVGRGPAGGRVAGAGSQS